MKLVMKWVKIALIVIILITVLSLAMCGRLNPASETWHLSSYVKTISFIGGVERDFGFAIASDVYPFAYADLSSVSISFSDDGKVEFVSVEGDRLSGTYRYEHVGNYTDVYMTFDNGETAEGSCMKQVIGGKYLMFVFRGINYTFSPVIRGVSPTLDEIVEFVRSGESESLYEVTVTKEETMYVAKFSDIVNYNIAEDTAAYAIEIHADGTYTVLDALKEGKALSTYNESANYIVLYYIEDAE